MTNLIIKQVDYTRSINAQTTRSNIVRTKINNCTFLLTRFQATRKKSFQGKYILYRQNRMHAIASSACNQSSDTLLTEARAARHYWDCIKIICKQDTTWTRIYPKARDPLNVSLNIGYTFLSRICEKALCASGLHLSLSVLHSHEHEKGLVYDFMELFRQAVVDAAVIPLFSRGNNELNPGKVITKIKDRLSEKYPYQGELVTINRIIEREAYELRRSIEKNIQWKPFRIQWGNSRKK